MSMKRGRTSTKQRIEFINCTKKKIEDCAHYNATRFELRTMRILAEAITQLELEVKTLQSTHATTIFHNLKPEQHGDN